MEGFHFLKQIKNKMNRKTSKKTLTKTPMKYNVVVLISDNKEKEKREKIINELIEANPDIEIIHSIHKAEAFEIIRKNERGWKVEAVIMTRKNEKIEKIYKNEGFNNILIYG